MLRRALGISDTTRGCAFVLLAVPTFLLAWVVARLPDPARGGRGPLLPDNAHPAAGTVRPRCRAAAGSPAGSPVMRCCARGT